jgi:hypothetical protein
MKEEEERRCGDNDALDKGNVQPAHTTTMYTKTTTHALTGGVHLMVHRRISQ